MELLGCPLNPGLPVGSTDVVQSFFMKESTPKLHRKAGDKEIYLIIHFSLGEGWCLGGDRSSNFCHVYTNLLMIFTYTCMYIYLESIKPNFPSILHRKRLSHNFRRMGAVKVSMIETIVINSSQILLPVQ